MIRYRILGVLLTLGVIFGYGSGIASLAWHHHQSCGSSCDGERAGWGGHSRWAPPPPVDPAVAARADREAFKAEVAAACADAVRRSLPPPAPAYAPQAPQMVPMPFAVPYPQPQYAPPPAPPAPPAPPSGT